MCVCVCFLLLFLFLVVGIFYLVLDRAVPKVLRRCWYDAVSHTTHNMLYMLHAIIRNLLRLIKFLLRSIIIIIITEALTEPVVIIIALKTAVLSLRHFRSPPPRLENNILCEGIYIIIIIITTACVCVIKLIIRNQWLNARYAFVPFCVNIYLEIITQENNTIITTGPNFEEQEARIKMR